MAYLSSIAKKRYGRLVAVRFSRRFKRSYYWIFKCDCGKTTEKIRCDVVTKKTTSCGCFRVEKLRKIKTIHGLVGTKIFQVHTAMMRRCYDKGQKNYHNYGGRGITVDKRWHSIKSFHKDMGDPVPGITLERIDNNGNYSKKNCKWATMKEQASNKRNNIIIDFNGVKKTMREWANCSGINYQTLAYRIKNWSIEEALTRDVQDPGR